MRGHASRKVIVNSHANRESVKVTVITHVRNCAEEACEGEEDNHSADATSLKMGK